MLKERFQNGEQFYGVFFVFFFLVVVEIFGWVGYDYVVVYLEYGFGYIMLVVFILQILVCIGMFVIICILVNDFVWVKKVLDFGF